MSFQVAGLHAAVGTVWAVMPGDANSMFVLEVGAELMVSFRFVATECAVPPDDANGMLRRKVHAEVLVGAGVKVAVRAAKGRAWPASAWRHYGHALGSRGTARRRDALAGRHRCPGARGKSAQSAAAAGVPCHAG